MKKTFFIFSVIVALIVSCTQYSKNMLTEYTIYDSSYVVLPLYDTAKNVIYDYQYIESDTGNILFLYNDNAKILVYDFDKQRLLSEIPLRREKLFNFHVIAKDSILLLYNSAYFNENTDSILRLIDFKGNEINTYRLNGEYFYSTNNRINKDKMFYFSGFANHLSYAHNTVYIPILKYSSRCFGDSASRSIDIPPVVAFDTKKDSLYFIEFKRFFPKNNYYYPNTFKSELITISKNDNPLLVYFSTPIIQEISGSKLYEYRLASEIMDTVLPQKKDLCNQFFFYENFGNFSFLHFDHYRNHYYRGIYLPSKFYKYKLIVLSDSSFNKIGELPIPRGFSSLYFFTKDYLVSFDMDKTNKTLGKLYFVKFKIKQKGKISADSFKRKLLKEPDVDPAQCTVAENNNNPKNIKNLLDIYIHEPSYTVLIVPFYRSCPSCKEYSVFFYALNKELFEKANVYLFFDVYNRGLLDNYLASKNLKVSKKIISDTTNNYQDYVDKFYNPRVVIVENNKVVYDKTYYPKELEKEMVDTIFASAHRRIEKSK